MSEESFLAGMERAPLEACDDADSFLQSRFWGLFKAAFGWTPLAFTADWGTFGSKPLLVISRPLAAGLSFAYVPWGPELPRGFPGGPGPRRAALLETARALRPFLPKSTCFVRFDPHWEAMPAVPASPLAPPLRKAGADVQPPDTVLVNLAQTEEALLAGMKPKCRYNVHLSGRKGVAIREAGAAGLESFYRLLTVTAARDGIAVHSRGYYETLFRLAAEGTGRERALCYLASHEGDDLAAAVVLQRGPHAVYLYGASSDRKRNLMAPYGLQFRAMLDAKAAGCVDYDLFGIPPDDNPAHPMAGLYRFKTGFGGAVVLGQGSCDYPYKPLWASLFRAAEKVRRARRTARRAARPRATSSAE
ncbi:MAG: peptidoglycan bridge formation glycyltransferase FemA/FemB family protein [Treponema sp.]|jgi:lipid II:glycine glycyltransferase (peptidoglycan interpeptide bridge formation enzyme)|nr:peptidoglycan bridge formation glycyltransferase FemA/FemB family protein [Treponema sp.]